MTNHHQPPAASTPEAADVRLATNMQRARESAGISQAELVRLLREIGGWRTVHQTTVSRIETGERKARVGEALAIAHVLGMSLEDLVADPVKSAAVGDVEEKALKLHHQFVLMRSVIWDYTGQSAELVSSLANASSLEVDEDGYPFDLARSTLDLTPERAIAETRGELPLTKRLNR